MNEKITSCQLDECISKSKCSSSSIRKSAYQSSPYLSFDEFLIKSNKTIKMEQASSVETQNNLSRWQSVLSLRWLGNQRQASLDLEKLSCQR